LVLLSGSSIIIFITILLANTDYHSPWTYRQIKKFSLEDGYDKISGKELPCYSFRHFDQDESYFKITCGDFYIPDSISIYYQELYDIERKSLYQKFGLNKYSGTCTGLARNNFGGLSKEEILCLNKTDKEMKLDPNYKKYEDALNDVAKIKVSTHINFYSIRDDIFYIIFVPILSVILWVIFWSSIIYRSILYVIFGSKHQQINK
jgi:hypothetical protein